MKDNKFKKIALPIGAVALVTLPFVSVISCSNNDSSGTNDGGGNVTPPQPEDKIPYLEGTWNIKPTEYNKDGYAIAGKDLFYESDLKVIKEKIANNEVKVKNEDGSYVKYEMTITLNPGVTFAQKGNVDPNSEYNSDTNQFKVLNKDKSITTSFEIDFDPSKKQIIGFLDFENTIAIASFPINSTNDRDAIVTSLGYSFRPNDIQISFSGWDHPKKSEMYVKNKRLFSKVDTPELKYADWTNSEEGKKGKLFDGDLFVYVTNVSGTISIKPIINNIND